MLRLYLDDAGSQTNPAKQVFAIGGYVAPAEVWEYFCRSWQSVLDEMHAPVYHATDCESGRNGYGHGAFALWDSDQLLKLKKKLYPLTHQLSAGVGRGLLVPEHNEHLLNDPYFSNRVGGGKYYPLFLLLEATLDWIASDWPDRPASEKIAVIFEGGTLGVGIAASVFKCLREHMSWAAEAFTDILDTGGKDLPTMQAADMLAFETYKDLEGQQLKPPRTRRKILTRLAQHGRISMKRVAYKDYSAIRDMYLAWEEQWQTEGGG